MKEERNALVARPSTAVGRISAEAGSALSQIVSDALALARLHATSVTSVRFEWVIASFARRIIGKYCFGQAR